jgi:hypothetical protein
MKRRIRGVEDTRQESRGWELGENEENYKKGEDGLVTT